MAGDILLKIEGIKGETKIEGMTDYIDVTSFSWGSNNASTMHFGGGAGTAKGNTHDLMITKRIDNASPDFYLKTMLGQHYDKATLVARLASGDKPVEYFKMEMEKVYVTSWTPHLHGDEKGSESVSLSFAIVKVIYTPQAMDGKKGTPVEVKFDILKHVKV